MAKRIRAARHYQPKDAPVRLIADKAKPALARAFSRAFADLGVMAQPHRIEQALKAGHHPASVINWHHYREALKQPFGKIAETYQAGAELGARKINGAFHARGRKVHFRKLDMLEWENIKPHIVTRYDVRSGAVASAKEPNVVYVDPRIPAVFHRFLAIHELVERRAMIDFGYDYNTAHTKFATPAERAAVEAAGLDWHKYTEEMDGYLSAIEHESVRETPPDPHIDPDEAVRAGHHHSHNKHSVDKSARGVVEKAFTFDSLSADTQARLRQAQDDLIQQLEADARDAIEVIVRDGEMYGTALDDVAENIRDLIGLTDTQAQAVLNYEQMLNDLDPQALARQLRNSEYDSVLQDAIDSGEDLSAAAIDRMVGDYVDNYLDYRAATIARTEATRAANWGLHDAYRQAAERGAFPEEAITRNWQLADHPCPICESIPDNNPDGVGLNEQFDSDEGSYDDAPVHPNCECSVEYVTDLSMVPDEGGDDGENEEG